MYMSEFAALGDLSLSIIKRMPTINVKWYLINTLLHSVALACYIISTLFFSIFSEGVQNHILHHTSPILLIVQYTCDTPCHSVQIESCTHI